MSEQLSTTQSVHTKLLLMLNTVEPLTKQTLNFCWWQNLVQYSAAQKSVRLLPCLSLLSFLSVLSHFNTETS